MRDPRVEPVKGDIVRQAWAMGRNGYTDHVVFNRCGMKDRVVETWLQQSNMKKRMYRCFDLADWQYRLKTAEVIKRGDDTP